MEVKFKPIGTIFSPFKTREGMPIQSSIAQGIKGTIKLKREFIPGVKDLGGFSHVILIYWLHQSTGYNLHVTPFLDDKPHGVFATRAPKRPNPIGISVVRLLEIKDDTLEIENIDILNETPLLDIKPYISRFDVHETNKEGWLSGKENEISNKKSDDRFE
jgi:tRNA-Thr(GGU) m(6)t(6)A37 methyltransferase TsaA